MIRGRTIWFRLTLLGCYALCSAVGTGWHSLLGCYHAHGCHGSFDAGTCANENSAGAHYEHGECDAHGVDHAASHLSAAGDKHAAQGTNELCSAVDSCWSEADNCPICRYQSQSQTATTVLALATGAEAVSPYLASGAQSLGRECVDAYRARAPPQAL